MKSLRLRHLALPFAIIALIAASVLLASPWMGQGFELADLSTDSQDRLTRQLDDGSLLTLDARTAVDVEFTRAQRRVQLLKGQVMVEVAKGDPRPFFVLTPQGSLRPLDARLIVERLEGVTEVTVLEGRVELEGPPGHLSLRRGQHLRFDGSTPGDLSNVDTSALQAGWYLLRLPGEGQPLVETLERLARHHQGLLLFDRETLADLQVQQDLPLDDSAEALAALQAALPIRISHYTRWITVVRRQ